MFQFILSRTALILLSTTLTVLTVACNKERPVAVKSGNGQPASTFQKSVESTTRLSPSASPQPEPEKPQLSALEVSYFEQGLDKAVGALSISQSAQSVDDWRLVVVQLQDAIALMQKVPVESSYFASAQAKIVDYQRQLTYATQKATRSVKSPQQTQPEKIVVSIPQTPIILSTIPPSFSEPLTTPVEKPQIPLPKTTLGTTPEQQEAVAIPATRQKVYTTPIKRRIGGTPIIEVTFNGNQQYEMILDTGASGTVITQKMANALGVVQVGRAKANTASSKAIEFPIGYVDSIEVSGAMVNRVAVAIAGVELETGLLGHDFFGDYDITIKRDVIEFRPQLQKEAEFTAPNAPKERRVIYP